MGGQRANRPPLHTIVNPASTFGEYKELKINDSIQCHNP